MSRMQKLKSALTSRNNRPEIDKRQRKRRLIENLIPTDTMNSKRVILGWEIRKSHWTERQPVQIMPSMRLNRHVNTDVVESWKINLRQSNSWSVFTLGNNCPPRIHNLKKCLGRRWIMNTMSLSSHHGMTEGHSWGTVRSTLGCGDNVALVFDGSCSQ